MKFIVVDDIKQQRPVIEVRFMCFCGQDVFLNKDDGIKECKCGRKYRLAQYVEIEEK